MLRIAIGIIGKERITVHIGGIALTQMVRAICHDGVRTTGDDHVNAAVEYSSYENMKKMESKQQFRLAGGRMMPRDKDNPNSYKVRRAKVGGYRDYFTDEEVVAIDRLLAETLDPMFGYK